MANKVARWQPHPKTRLPPRPVEMWPVKHIKQGAMPGIGHGPLLFLSIIPFPLDGSGLGFLLALPAPGIQPHDARADQADRQRRRFRRIVRWGRRRRWRRRRRWGRRRRGRGRGRWRWRRRGRRRRIWRRGRRRWRRRGRGRKIDHDRPHHPRPTGKRRQGVVAGRIPARALRRRIRLNRPLGPGLIERFKILPDPTASERTIRPRFREAGHQHVRPNRRAPQDDARHRGQQCDPSRAPGCLHALPPFTDDPVPGLASR